MSATPKPTDKPTDASDNTAVRGALRHIQSLERGVRLLRVVAESPYPLTGVEAADRSGINRSTAWRLLATLEQEGLVERGADGLFQVGLSLFTLAAAAPWAGVALRARPLLESLSVSTNETAVVAIAHGGGFEVLDQVDGPHVLSVRWVGVRMPLLCTSVGKLILAALPEEQLDGYLRHPIPARTPRTRTEPDDILAELDEVRRTGLGTSVGDYELGVNGVSAAARDARGRPVAFVTVTGPDIRLPESRMGEIGPLVLDTAWDLEHALGLREPEERKP
jgi:IclR family transcriptional regulator, KDG regulon repressor